MTISLKTKRLLLYYATFSWISSILFTIISYFNYYFQLTFKFQFILFIGVFIVWIPIVFLIKQQGDVFVQSSLFLQKINFKILFSGTPKWMIFILIFTVSYTFINFIFFLPATQVNFSEETGLYVLESKGKVIRHLTSTEYFHRKGLEFRGISGHLMIFYGISTAILFKYKK